MTAETSIFVLMLAIGVIFGVLAGGGAYVISLSEYRKRFLRPDQNPRKMAFEVAAMAFAFFVVAAMVLGFILSRSAR